MRVQFNLFVKQTHQLVCPRLGYRIPSDNRPYVCPNPDVMHVYVECVHDTFI